MGFSWPTQFAGFNLETTTDLPPAAIWQTVVGPYILSNGSFGATFTNAVDSRRFFRLRKPLP
jgi:hypothetical protein